jgi:hypothetical protein
MSGAEADVSMAAGAELARPADHPELSLHAQLSDMDDSRAYGISDCTQRRYLQIRLEGIWDHPVFDRFAVDYLAAVERLAGSGGVTHQMVDATDFCLQGPDIAERFALLIAQTFGTSAPRTACVVPSMVNRVQARVGGDLINARYFRTTNDAADWLFGDEA